MNIRFLLLNCLLAPPLASSALAQSRLLPHAPSDGVDAIPHAPV